MLQAPVATSVSGKGVIAECHPLAVGWGYGPQGTRTAEKAFKHVDGVLAIGVRYSEVSTAFYAIPPHRSSSTWTPTRTTSAASSSPSLRQRRRRPVPRARCWPHADDDPPAARRRPGLPHPRLEGRGGQRNAADDYARCGVDPMPFLLALRKATCPDALMFVDVTCAEHWAAEAFTVCQPRTYFNPTDNQAMGWSIPAAIGAQRVHPGRQVVTVTGDGCFLMTAMEISTAAREGLPVKFFMLDDQAYHYMQVLQKPAYLRTTATILARLDYAALAKGFGVGYQEIDCDKDLEGGVRAALEHAGAGADARGHRLRQTADPLDRRGAEPVHRRADEGAEGALLARLGSRSLDLHPNSD